MYEAGTTLFCVTPTDDLAIIEAKEYIAEKKLNAENAKMVKRDNQLLVILKKDMEI